MEPDYVLVLDGADGALGPLALQLLGTGIDCSYAPSPEEGVVLAARPEGARARAVVLPEALEVGSWRAVAARLRGPGGAPGLVVVGDLADPGRAACWRKAGAVWALRPPFAASTLRFVVNAALSEPARRGQRLHPRVPTTLCAAVAAEGRHRELPLTTLSLGGCFLETPLPFALATAVEVVIPLPDGPVRVRGLVANRHAAGDPGPPHRPLGMGVAFEALPVDLERSLAFFVAEQALHFRV